MPAVRFIGLIKPGLKNLSEQDPKMISAQKELAEIQSKVRKLVLSRDDIDRINWRIDKEWYSERGIWIQ
jgi:ribosomal protein S15P/S13E